MAFSKLPPEHQQDRRDMGSIKTQGLRSKAKENGKKAAAAFKKACGSISCNILVPSLADDESLYGHDDTLSSAMVHADDDYVVTETMPRF